jgi:hypothetical protein
MKPFIFLQQSLKSHFIFFFTSNFFERHRLLESVFSSRNSKFECITKLYIQTTAVYHWPHKRRPDHCFKSETLPLVYQHHESYCTMADDIDEQVTAHICEILHLVYGVKGKTLRKLNELVGQTSKFKLHSITDVFAEVIMVQNYGVEAD